MRSSRRHRQGTHKDPRRGVTPCAPGEALRAARHHIQSRHEWVALLAPSACVMSCACLGRMVGLQRATCSGASWRGCSRNSARAPSESLARAVRAACEVDDRIAQASMVHGLRCDPRPAPLLLFVAQFYAEPITSRAVPQRGTRALRWPRHRRGPKAPLRRTQRARPPRPAAATHVLQKALPAQCDWGGQVVAQVFRQRDLSLRRGTVWVTKGLKCVLRRGRHGRRGERAGFRELAQTGERCSARSARRWPQRHCPAASRATRLSSSSRWRSEVGFDAWLLRETCSHQRAQHSFAALRLVRTGMACLADALGGPRVCWLRAPSAALPGAVGLPTVARARLRPSARLAC